jgi:hypothetical protein
MMKWLRIGLGALMAAAGLFMLVAVFRAEDVVDPSQAMIGPLALMGAGALAISASRKPPKKC